MLGVPPEDWDIFQRWARVDGSDPAVIRRDPARMHHMQQEMFNYFSRLLEDRRRSPREDLITALCHAEVDGERLSEEELVSFCLLLFFDGQATTENYEVALSSVSSIVVFFVAVASSIFVLWATIAMLVAEDRR